MSLTLKSPATMAWASGRAGCPPNSTKHPRGMPPGPSVPGAVSPELCPAPGAIAPVRFGKIAAVDIRRRVSRRSACIRRACSRICHCVCWRRRGHWPASHAPWHACCKSRPGCRATKRDWMCAPSCSNTWTCEFAGCPTTRSLRMRAAVATRPSQRRPLQHRWPLRALWGRARSHQPCARPGVWSLSGRARAHEPLCLSQRARSCN